MNNERLPVLTEDSSSLDWNDAEYDINLKRAGRASVVKVEHRTKGAASLMDAIHRGRATYVTEVRSPRCLYSREVRSPDSAYEVAWEDSDVLDDRTFLLGGVVSLGDAQANVEELHEFFGTDGRMAITLPEGRWAAKASICRLNPLLSGLLTFVKSFELPEGTMNVEEGASSGSPHFYVHVPPALFAAVHDPQNRALRIAALIGVFAHIPRSAMKLGGELDDHPITNELLEMLADKGVADWHEEEDFDPALAATVLEPFLIADTGNPGVEDGDEDDSQ